MLCECDSLELEEITKSKYKLAAEIRWNESTSNVRVFCTCNLSNIRTACSSSHEIKWMRMRIINNYTIESSVTSGQSKWLLTGKVLKASILWLMSNNYFNQHSIEYPSPGFKPCLHQHAYVHQRPPMSSMWNSNAVHVYKTSNNLQAIIRIKWRMNGMDRRNSENKKITYLKYSIN